MDVRISPLVELQEARAEIAHLRNRTLILAQALHELKERMIVTSPAGQGEIAAAQSSEADHADD